MSKQTYDQVESFPVHPKIFLAFNGNDYMPFRHLKNAKAWLDEVDPAGKVFGFISLTLDAHDIIIVKIRHRIAEEVFE